MKNRIFKNWSWIRAAYVGVGVIISIQAISALQWLGLAIGIYVTAMGVFAFGCASGNCVVKHEQDHKIMK